jgi:haloalkane dehalogenase
MNPVSTRHDPVTVNSPSAHFQAARPAWLDGADYPFQSRYLSLDGHRIHYIDEGSGPILLFLHGNPLWSFQYRHIIAPLRVQFRCIALDYPGFGLTEARPGFTNTLMGNSTLVERFVQTLALRDITPVVFDTSVSIGLGVVARHPEWFRALVISNGFAWPLGEDPAIYNFIRIVASSFFRFLVINFNLLLRYTVAGLDSQSKARLSKAERNAYLMPFANRLTRHHQHDLFRSIVDSRDYLLDLKNRLPELRHFPVLLAFADGDPTYKAGWLQRYEVIFPDHTSVLIKGSHHFPQEYDPGAMVRAIQDWWNREMA